MAELSRKKRFQELRDQLDEETSTIQTQQAPALKLSRSSRSAASPAKAAPAANQPDLGIMDEVFGEVKRYNIDNGDRVLEDTQINILKTLDEVGDAELKRRAHMETMEPNTNSGGTTMNINAKDIEQVQKAALNVPTFTSKLRQQDPISNTQSMRMPRLTDQLPAPAVPRSRSDRKADQGIVPTDGRFEEKLELFDLSADDFDNTIRQQPAQVSNPSPKEVKAGKKARKQQDKNSRSKAERMIRDTEPTGQYFQETDQYPITREEPKKSSRIGNIILILLILILLALIGYTIYLISKANLL